MGCRTTVFTGFTTGAMYLVVGMMYHHGTDPLINPRNRVWVPCFVRSAVYVDCCIYFPVVVEVNSIVDFYQNLYA